VGGTSVKTWILGKDGRWALQFAFIELDGKQTAEASTLRSGSMTAAQVTQVAEVLRSRRLNELPRTMGKKPLGNAHVYSLNFDKANSTLYGVPPLRKGTLKEHIVRWLPRGEEKAATRFADVAQVVVDVCQDKSPER
jgi:hypothetical protein